MPFPLKYSTASQEVPLGYFLDSTDGNTEETGLTIANTDIKLWKSGATTLANKNSGGATHISNGIYYATLDATDTNTYGPLVIFVHVAGALSVRLECVVMEADAYDALYAASGTGHIECDAVQISGDATAADNLELITELGRGVTINATGGSVGKDADDLVDDVWDEVLTGATHNIATSAGRRLRGIQEFQGYEDGAIWIDTVNGTAGTVDYENGTVENPVSTMADANTLSASLNINRFRVAPGSSITFAAAQNSQVFIGDGWTLALGGQQIVGSAIIGATVSGIAAGVGTVQTFRECIMNACTHIKGTRIIESGIAGTQTVGEAGDYFLDRCHSAIAGTSTWAWDFGAAIGNTNLNVRNYSGGIQLESMGDTGTDTASIEGRGQVIEGTCTGGTVAIRGNFTVSGITNLTLSDDARYDVNDIKFVADIVESQRGAHTWQGNKFYVGPNTGNDTTGDGSRSAPYATITKALAATSDNGHDLILLLADNPAGTTVHTEQVTISKNYVFIRGPGRDFLWNYDANGDVITITGEGVELSGFRLQTHTVGSGDAINVSGDFCRVHNMWLEYTRQYGIYIDNADHCQIHDNLISNCGKDTESAGVYIFQSGGGTAENNKIHDNVFEDNTGAAIETNGGVVDAVIKENNIHGSSTYGVLVGTGGTNTGVYGNTFSDNTAGDISDSGTNTYREKNNISLVLPGQEAPPATPTPGQANSYLYKSWRNKSTQSTQDAKYKLYADDGVTVDHQADVSDDGETFTKGEVGSGA